MTAASIANSVRPEIDVIDYFIRAENARHFWAVLSMVRSCHITVMFMALQLQGATELA